MRKGQLGRDHLLMHGSERSRLKLKASLLPWGSFRTHVRTSYEPKDPVMLSPCSWPNSYEEGPGQEDKRGIGIGGVCSASPT